MAVLLSGGFGVDLQRVEPIDAGERGDRVSDPLAEDLADIRGRVGGDQQDPVAPACEVDRSGAGDAGLPYTALPGQEQEPRLVVQ